MNDNDWKDLIGVCASNPMSVKEDGKPDYVALKKWATTYSLLCQRLTETISTMQDKAKVDGDLLSLISTKDDEITRLNKELEQHKQNEQDLRLENEQLKMEKKELNQMSQKLVQKTEHDDLLKAIRVYMNISKRKNAKKRGYIKMVFLEMAQSARLILPEDMQLELEKFDDEDPNFVSNMNYVAPVNPIIAHAENIAHQPTTIDEEGLRIYFKASFKGIGDGNIDYFKDFVPLLNRERKGKEVATIAYMIYQSDKLISTTKPSTFKAWHKIFCQLTDYDYREYKPARLTITDNLKNEFYMFR